MSTIYNKTSTNTQVANACKKETAHRPMLPAINRNLSPKHRQQVANAESFWEKKEQFMITLKQEEDRARMELNLHNQKN